MSKAKRDEGLSAEDLKRKMYQSLQSAGVLNNLKGYLRQSVINELRGKHKRSQPMNESDLLAATIGRKEEGTWSQKALDNLILHHLKQSRYHYSLSLFQQEAGISEYNEALTEELLHRLGASPDLLRSHGADQDKENDQSLSFSTPHTTSTPVAHGNNQSKLLLWNILSKISSVQNLGAKIDAEQVFREKERIRPMTLADKLQAVDEEMDGTLRERRLGDIEQRKSVAMLASATRRAEEAAEKRAKDSLEQWKKVELVSMRVKEAEKARETIAEKTKQFEEDYSQRKEALLQREQSAIERLNHQKETLERDLHQQRQLLLQELEQIRMREKNLHDREHMMNDIEAVKLKELDLMKSEVLSSQRLQPMERGHQVLEKSRRDSVVSSCAESLRKSLTGKEGRQLDEVLRELDSRSHEAEMLRRELESMKEEMSHTKRQLEQIAHQRPLSSAPRPETSPRDQDQSLRRRLDDLTRQLNDWRQKDRNEKEATIQSEIGRWKNEVTKLSEARDQLDEKQQRLEEMTVRLHTQLNSAPRASEKPPARESSATALRILMDPQADAASRSIREYDPVYTGRVRWADKMPYSVHPGLVGQDKSPRRPSRNLSANSNTELNDSNESSSSSQDLSTSGLRLNIQQKFRDLEKESDALEQVYKRYMQTNYKHVASDIPSARSPSTSPRNSPRMSRIHRPQHSYSADYQPKHRGNLHRPIQPRERSSVPGERGTAVPLLPEYKPTSAHSSALTDGQNPTILPRNTTQTSKPLGDQDLGATEAVEVHGRNEERLPEGGIGHNREKYSDRHKTALPDEDLDTKYAARSRASTKNEEPVPAEEAVPEWTVAHGRSPLKLDDLGTVAGFTESKSETAESGHSQRPMSASLASAQSEFSKTLSSDPSPSKRLGALPPLSSTTPLPQITPRRGRRKAPASQSAAELLLGPDVLEPMERQPQAPRNEPQASDDLLGSFFGGKTGGMEQKSAMESNSDSESHPLKLSSLRVVSGGENDPDVKSPFERPALLGVKRDELQRSLDQSEKDSPKHEQHPESPKPPLSFHDDDGLQNILDSIDMNSAQSLEGDADPKLTDLLSQLEQNPTVMSRQDESQSSEESENQPGFHPAKQQEKLDSEKPRLAAGTKVAKQQQEEDSEQSGPEREEKLLSDRSADDHSDKFLSSTASKSTSSEIKTMSDFEPSSTSIPRIDDKVAGSQRTDDEEKSGADVHWSHLQFDKSGELLPSDAAKEPLNDTKEETVEGRDIDVFGEDQSSHSFEAASDVDKKSQSSGEDFW